MTALSCFDKCTSRHWHTKEWHHRQSRTAQDRSLNTPLTPRRQATKAYQHWAKTLRHRQVKFDQCQLGQLVAKSTTLSTDLDLGHWTGMICDHPGHSDLSRYPWKMMKGLAQAIAIRARPILQNPTPGLQVTTQFELGQHQPMKGGDSPSPTRSMYTSQSSPAGMTPEHTTSATRSNPATKEPPALSGKGSLETPSHRSQGSKRSPPRSPAQHRASKGLKALSLLTSGTHTKADNNDQQTPTTTWTEESTSLWTPISMEQLMRTSDKPLVEPLANDIHLFDDIVMFHVAFKSRPLRDGGGKPSPGRLAPPCRVPSSLGRLGKQIMSLVLPMVPQTVWSAQCGEKQHPFPEELLNTIRTTLGSPPNAQPPPGQPLFLELIQDLSNRSGDPDWAFPTDLSQGVPLGVTTPPLHSPGIWPLKSELKGMEFIQQELEQPMGLDNYSSVKDFAPQVRATFVEEVQLGMVEGPLTKQQAALRCSCREEDLCPGPLAAIDEGDKIRTIYDGSAGGANIHIQNQTMERTTAPTVLDCVQALHWLHEASNSQPPTVPHLRDEPTEAQHWQWPKPKQQWFLLKADVTKAHRRVKVLPRDWRFQVAELEGEWWINKVGTYGMASAQLYWGRTAALILRLLYNLFPQVDWGFVFVDDFCWLLRAENADHQATAILATLVALGVPLSWKKTHLAEVNTWLGFVIHPNIPQVQMISTKHILVLEVLELLIQNTVMTTKAIEKALGRLQWATAVCPMTKSLLQPFWAWKMAVTSSGRPPKTVRLLALLLKELFTIPYRQLSPYLPKSSWWGCSDASADSTGEAYIGGWLSDAQSPARDSVHWFHFKVSPEMFPWAFKDGNPQKRIAALELLGTLVLTHCILQKQGKTAAAVRIPVGSDNQGNVFALLNFASKKPHTAAILMELVLRLHVAGCSLAPCHVPRELNQWADDLTHPLYGGFSSELYLDVSDLFVQLKLLPRLTSQLDIDFSQFPSHNPVTGFGGLSCSLSPFPTDVTSRFVNGGNHRPGTPGWLDFDTVQEQHTDPNRREPGQTGTNPCTGK